MSIIIISLRKKKYFHILISSREGARKSYGKLQHFKAKWLMHITKCISHIFNFHILLGEECVCVVNQGTYFNTIIIVLPSSYFCAWKFTPNLLQLLDLSRLKKSHISNFSVISNRIMFCSGHYPEWTKMGGPSQTPFKVTPKL